MVKNLKQDIRAEKPFAVSNAELNGGVENTKEYTKEIPNALYVVSRLCQTVTNIVVKNVENYKQQKEHQEQRITATNLTTIRSLICA